MKKLQAINKAIEMANASGTRHYIYWQIFGSGWIVSADKLESGANVAHEGIVNPGGTPFFDEELGEADGIRRISCFNGGLSAAEYRCNSRLFKLSVDLADAQKEYAPKS